MPQERKDFFKIGENFVTIVGNDVQVGQQAPVFTASEQNWAVVNPLAESKGKSPS